MTVLLLGILCGLALGLIIGGLIGYASKAYVPWQVVTFTIHADDKASPQLVNAIARTAAVVGERLGERLRAEDEEEAAVS